jgi:RND family efflux transporter MFP subunit
VKNPIAAVFSALLFSLAPPFLLACGDSAAEGAVAPPERSAPEVRVRVRTALVERAKLASSDRVAGTVRAFHDAMVKAETSGRVLRRAVERGDAVSQGDVLIELDASRLALELRQAEATVRSRRTDLAHAEREHERGESLVERNAISEQRRDDLRHGLDAARNAYALAIVARDTAQRLLEDASVRAPIDGSVDDLLVDVGDFVAAGTPVAHVLDLSRARIFGGVTAEEAARLSQGMLATASFASLGGLSQPAELRSVARAADPGDGTYRIELWIDAPDPRLRDGVVAMLEFEGSGAEAQPLVPRAALIRHGGRSEVFIIERGHGNPDGVAKRRIVRTGRTGLDQVEILAGIAAGDEVVVDGQFALQDGSSVSVERITRETPAAEKPSK